MTLIIIPTWNHLETTTRHCVNSVLKYTGDSCSIVCVDNASEDGTRAFLAETSHRDPRLTWIAQEENLGWAQGSLRGMHELREEDRHFCLLNSDTIVTPRWLEKMLEHLKTHPGLAMVIPNEVPDEPIPPGPVPLSEILRRARDVEKQWSGLSRPCAPSGFCVLVDAEYRPSVEEYLKAFHRFQHGELDWQDFFAEHNLDCRLALDTFVFHTRSGSGGYEGYRP